MEILNQLEQEQIISKIKCTPLKELGTTIPWATRHQQMRRLHQQLTQNTVMAGTENRTDYIKERLVDSYKMVPLLKELLTAEVWRLECLPVIMNTADFSARSTLPLDMILEHELVVLAIIANVTYHADALESLGDNILDLVDYCHRALNSFISVSSRGETEETGTDNRKMLSKRLYESSFKMAESVLSILFHMTSNIDAVPISTVDRLLNRHNLPQFCVELVQTQPFRSDGKAFFDGDWHKISDARKVTKLEGLTFALIFNMVAQPDVFEKYEMSSTNIASILRLTSYVGQPHVLEQFGFLTALKAQLDYIQVQGPSFIASHNKANKTSLIIESEPELRDQILSSLPSRIAIAADQMRFWIANQTTFLPKFAMEINKSFDADTLMALDQTMKSYTEKTLDSSATPECAKCGKVGMKRCGRCQMRWYCSPECQRVDWKQHKKRCKPMESALTS